MANNQNKCNFTGRLGGDPEVKFSKAGTAYASVNIACSGSKKTNGEWVEHTEWIPLTFFGRQAEVVGEYCNKGSMIRVEGRFQTHKFDKDGQTHYRSSIAVNELELLGGKQSSNQANNSQQSSQSNRQQQAQVDDFEDDSIPF